MRTAIYLQVAATCLNVVVSILGQQIHANIWHL